MRFVPEFNKLFVASGTDGSVKTLDGTTLAVIHTANVSLGADAIGYDPRSKYSMSAPAEATPIRNQGILPYSTR